MSNYKAMGSLAEKLSGYVNTTLEHDTNYEIASVMLKKYSEIKHMNLSQMAEACYVSKSAISRFCRFMGFETFGDFQETINQDFSINEEYSKKFRTLMKDDFKQAYISYCDDLRKNIKALSESDGIDDMPAIMMDLCGSKKISYFSHHFLWDIGHYFQSKMLMMERYVELFNSYDGQLECAKSLGKDDFAIVCTLGGSYPYRYGDIWNALVKSGCKILVITQNTSNSYWNNAEYILKCGDTNQNDVGKYSVLMMTDMMIMNYMNLTRDNQ